MQILIKLHKESTKFTAFISYKLNSMNPIQIQINSLYAGKIAQINTKSYKITPSPTELQCKNIILSYGII